MAADDAGDVALQLGVERRLDPRRARSPGGAQHHLDEVRREERRRVRARRSAARRAPRAPARRVSAPAAAMRRSTRRCRATAAVRLRCGLKPDGRCGRPARNAACAGVSIDASVAEVRAAGALGADDLVAVGGEVQIQREDLALGEAMLEPQRQHRLANLRAQAARPRPALRRLSSSLATCCVIVEPPSTTCRSHQVVPDGAQDREHGSTPGCDQKRRSSAAIVAATSTGGRCAASSLTVRVAVAGQRFVQRHARADRRRPSTACRSRSSRSADERDRQRGSRAPSATSAATASTQDARRLQCDATAGRLEASPWHSTRRTSIDRRRRPAEHLRLVHLLRARRRRPERPGGRRADDVGELVAAFAEPRGEELDAIVVALDVIEAAALPPRESSLSPVSSLIVLLVVRAPRRSSRTTTRPARSRPAADR